MRTILASLILLCASSTLCFGENGPANVVDRIPIVLAPRHSAVLSAQVTSKVTRITRAMGEPFDENDTLLKLDDTSFSANKAKAKAILERAEVQLKAKEELFRDNVASFFELKDAEAEAATARADLIIAKQSLQETSISAPFPGHLVDVFVDEHEMVQAGQPLLEVVDDRVLLAKFLIPSTNLQTVTLHQKVWFYIRETGKRVSGNISNIGAVIDPSSSMVKVYAEIDNYDDSLSPGMIGHTSLQWLLDSE